MNAYVEDGFRDISQIEALALMDGKRNKPFNKPQFVKENTNGLKKELADLKLTIGQRNAKIKTLNADKITLQNQVKALESRLAYFEQFKIKARHHVGTDEFLKIIEQVGK